MAYLNKAFRNMTWATFLLVALSLALVTACADSEQAEEDPTPTATAAPATEALTATPTLSPDPTMAEPPPTAPPAEVPSPTPAPEPTAVPSPEPEPTPEPAPEAYPLEAMDMIGREVTIQAKPMRIVSLSPTATEMLYIAGGTAIARDTSSTFPAEVQDLPELGGAYSPSFESIAAQGADLILIEALTQGRFLEPLSQFGAPVVAVRATSLDDIIAGIRLIGMITGNEETAEQAAQEIAGRVASAIDGRSAGESALILISDADRNLYAAKMESYPGAIASMLQLSNPAADLPDSGTFPGFALISAEQVLTMNPDYLFTITPAPEPVPRLSAMLPRIPGFASLRAISSGQIHEIDHVIFLRNQGPRIAEAVEAMAELTGGAP